MPALYLITESGPQKFPIGDQPITIGRAPENTIHLPNPAVSSRHAKVYRDGTQVVVEDCGSMNGTYVADERVKKAALKNGAEVRISTHYFRFAEDEAALERELKAAAAPTASSPAPLPRSEPRNARPDPNAYTIGKLTIADGKSPQRHYLLESSISIVGKSDAALVKMDSWMAPPIAAVFERKGDRYYIKPSPDAKEVKVNLALINAETELAAGDIIEIGKLKMEFGFSETIVVVEDDPELRKLVEKSLRMAGYRCYAAGDGESGLKLIRDQKPSVVVMDLILPRMHGHAVCRELRKDPKFRRTCIILASGQTHSLTPEKAREVGADFCLPKPYDVKQLMGLISGRHVRA
jgi:CheY-like chemotaxis protein/pSer/pThr/pTyr-binding forkhead associated (FHA) protein